ncbi:C-terminal processing protease CtpA/Prc [Chitinophaga dinghuensis]|uniref:Tricorn protease homolog n=1 Tax=Chitinophaga dinghuensis TaxID=1539050 RepID=A0A327VXQ4_9BACT|nr:S41 family peptidase [Chitinophaga dinghuensis]RAJ76542.1 C-terminal processing protease CtpA/Prc [Chitinophaga dinghuensis]
MKKLLLGCAAFLLAANSYAQDHALWLRNPAISPDGNTIAFGYKGDIYRVDAKGGIAVPLTIHEAHDMMPVWSHDGKHIAFASNRYGNFDVFVMPATGGNPLRLTYNSTADYPYDFSPDNQQVLFGSARNAPAASIRFPYFEFRNAYTVPVTGGRPFLVSAAGIENAAYNKDGSKIIFQDYKGHEDPFRKHHTSSITRDIWIMDIAKGTYEQISAYEGEDREPVFGNNNDVYYLSEKGGISQNLFKSSLSDKSKMEQLTSFTGHPVRYLSKSSGNTFCFTYNGEVYTMKEGEQPRKVPVQILNDGRESVVKNMPVTGNITEFAMSPDGKEMAFIARGEVYVSSVNGNMTKRITNTPQQERMVAWSPDGKRLIYAAERNGNWDIYQTTRQRKEEPYFFNATLLKEEPLIATAADEFQPKYSPDGKEVAYVENRNILKVFNLASGQSRTLLPEGHNHSYSDGDWFFNWSPDSKWILVDDQRNASFVTVGWSNIAVLPAAGNGSPFYPVNSGFGETNGKWSADGKLMTWTNDREGRRSLAQEGSRETDIYGVFLDQEAYDKFKLSNNEFSLLKGAVSAASKDTSITKDSAGPKKIFQPDFNNLDTRQVRLTIHSASISDYVVNKDASKVFYMAEFENGYDLWATTTRTGETSILAKLGGSPGSMELSNDGNSLFLFNDGSVVKVDVNSGKVTPVNINSEMTLNLAKEREYIYWHTWKLMKETFYDPNLHGVDWKMYGDNYARFLPYISNNYDFQELLSELLGELNASHTGSHYTPVIPNADVTACLGLLYNETYQSDGLKVDEVIKGGPLDKAASKLKKGDIIEKIDGVAVTGNIDWAMLLNRKTGANVLLSIYNPATKQRWDETVKPVSAREESRLLFKRWVNNMSDMVDKLSGGKVGYVYVKSMDDASFRSVYDAAMGKQRDKKALIVDTRFNGGGILHEELMLFLTGKKYLTYAPQGHRLEGGEPVGIWKAPSCVLVNEANYSDAFIFPYVYKQEKVGKLIGMPVAGTGTCVWWEQQIDPTIKFGIPSIATIGKENRPTENLPLEPDIRVPLRYEEFLAGKDAQIEAAVKEMLKEVK